MHNIKFEEQNHVILAPPGQNLRNLNLWTDGKCCISVYEITDEDLRLLAENRKLYMICGTSPKEHPLIGLSAENIIPNKNPLNLILPNG